MCSKFRRAKSVYFRDIFVLADSRRLMMLQFLTQHTDAQILRGTQCSKSPFGRAWVSLEPCTLQITLCGCCKLSVLPSALWRSNAILHGHILHSYANFWKENKCDEGKQQAAGSAPYSSNKLA